MQLSPHEKRFQLTAESLVVESHSAEPAASKQRQTNKQTKDTGPPRSLVTEKKSLPSNAFNATRASRISIEEHHVDKLLCVAASVGERAKKKREGVGPEKQSHTHLLLSFQFFFVC
jgi:hypothetical protein